MTNEEFEQLEHLHREYLIDQELDVFGRKLDRSGGPFMGVATFAELEARYFNSTTAESTALHSAATRSPEQTDEKAPDTQPSQPLK